MTTSPSCVNLARISEGWSRIHAESVALISKVRSAAGTPGDDMVVAVDEASWKLSELLSECEALIAPQVTYTCEKAHISSESSGE